MNYSRRTFLASGIALVPLASAVPSVTPPRPNGLSTGI
jgi:hypothetical protein